MATIVSYLQDANTVAAFQRFCGIVSRCPTVPSGNGCGDGPVANGNSKSIKYRMPFQSQCNGDTHNVRNVNDDMDKTRSYIVTNWFLYYLFHFGANLGNEIFYMTFFPFWFWNIDGWVGRQLCIFWCIFMYFGQAMKDIVKIPRPSSPPVIQLEKRYALEYGMPSTHAMVGAGIPFSIFFLTMERYIVS